MTVSSDVSTERKMHIFDLSRSGLSFKMIDTVDVKKGDELFVRFNLDDAKQSLIHKKVVVKLINDNFLVACFEDDVDLETIKQIAELNPLRMVFKDSSFKNDATKVNCDEYLKNKLPNTIVKVI